MRLAVMRPKDKLDESIVLAQEMGLEVVAASPLRIEVNDGPELDLFLSELKKGLVDAVVLTSSTGVDALVGLLGEREEMGPWDCAFRSCRCIAIGPLTAEAMRSRGLQVDLIPDEYSSVGLVDALSRNGIRGKRIYLLRSSHGERALVDGLEGAGAVVKEVVLYNLVPQPDSPELQYLVRESLAGRVDAFAFTSSLSAATFIQAAERIGPREAVVGMLNARLVAAMGGPTKRKLEEMGIRVKVVPERATFSELLKALMARA